MRVDRRTLGWTTVAVSAAYFASDAVEAADGGFSTGQLVLTLVCEALIPFIAIGICAAQRPAIGRLGWMSAIGYAVAYVAFTGTVVYALAEDTPDYDSLTDDLGAWMAIPGVIMIVAGIGFGIAVIRAGELPAWTGAALAAGVVLVAATQEAPAGAALLAAAVRAAAWGGMGLALVSGGGPDPTRAQPIDSR